MRIPQYTSEQRISAPQVATTKIADPVDLSKVINIIENQYEIGIKEQEREQKLFYANEVARTQLALDEEYAKASEAIANGDYKAKDRYNEFYNNTVQQSLSRFSDYDPEIVEAARIDFERTGVGNGMRLKTAVRSKIKSDALSSSKLRLETLKRSYFDAQSSEEQQSILSDVNKTVANLEANNAIARGSGAEVVRSWVGDIETQKIILESQTNPLNALNSLEKNKSNLDIDTYVSLKGRLLSQKKEIEDLAVAESFLRGESEETPNQEQVDSFANTQEVLEQEGKINAFEKISLNAAMIAKTGRLPDVIKQNFDGLFYMQAEEVTPEDAGKIVYASRIVSEAVSENPALINNSGVSKEQALISDLVVEQLYRGVDQTTAVKNILNRVNNPDFKNVYDDARNFILKSGSNQNYSNFVKEITSELDIGKEYFGLVRKEAIDNYAMSRAYGASHKDAVKSTKKSLQGLIGNFNGQTVMLPPQAVTRYKNEKAWVQMANSALTKINPSLSGKVEPVLYGDEITRLSLAKNANDKDVSFVLGYSDVNGGVTPVIDENGSLVRVKANPRQSTIDETIANRISKWDDGRQARFYKFIQNRGFTDDFVKNNEFFVRLKFFNSDYWNE